ncbi:hypothetical protein MMG00_04745 [Ignatzschineria rhizosphaerae]|uniref:Uncharacterized protein n=1 Tax=Ignatzschineria rhizosphaerae TaxID=2923279 RepID=A0ABY3X5X2_9GAMM|nr:hypothetical protein [Ignatzschineria rhizosphaerae]UNM97161.1 hypothetical protein MMG00_04745 [Ignatzschineria rhizosphaerae]
MKKIALSLLLASASLFSYACESNAPIVEGYQIDCPFDAKKGTFKEYPQPSKSTVIHQQEINDEIFDVVRLTVDKDGNISEITKNAIVQMTTDNVIEKYVALEVDYFKLKAELTKLYGEPIEGKEVLPFPQVDKECRYFIPMQNLHMSNIKLIYIF